MYFIELPVPTSTHSMIINMSVTVAATQITSAHRLWLCGCLEAQASIARIKWALSTHRNLLHFAIFSIETLGFYVLMLFMNCTKTALTRSIFFRPKCTKCRLAAGFLLDTLGKHKCSTRLLSHGRGNSAKKERKEKRGRAEEGGKEGRKGRERREGKGKLHTHTSCQKLAPMLLLHNIHYYTVGQKNCTTLFLSLIHIWRCRRSTLCRSRWSPYH